MKGSNLAVLGACLLLGACTSGPLVSDAGITKSANGYASDTTASGSYCLSKTLLWLEVSNSNLSAGAGDLPGSNLHGGSPDVSIKLQPIEVPDVEHIFSLSYRESIFSNDTINLQFVHDPTRTCILKRISADVEDRSLEVAKTVAATVLHAMTGTPGGGAARLLGAKPQCPGEIQLLLDVDRVGYEKEQERANSALHNACFDLSIFVQPVGALQGTQGVVEPDPSKSYDGVFYRTPLPYRFTIQRGQSAVLSDADVEAQGVFFSENGAPLQFLSIKRSDFVRRQTAIDFDNGLPIVINTVKPSQAEEFAKFPLDLTDQILSIPALNVHVHNEK